MVTHAWQTTDEGDRAEAVAAVLAAGDPRGWTAAEIAETLNLSLDVRDVQRDLEGLVGRLATIRDAEKLPYPMTCILSSLGDA